MEKIRTIKEPVTINYDDVICYNVLIPQDYMKFADFIKIIFSIDDALFGLNSIMISYKFIETSKKESIEKLTFIEEPDNYQTLIARIKKKKVNEIFIAEKKYIGQLVDKPEIFEKKIEEVVFNELYKTRNNIINECLEYQKNSEKCHKMNNKVNTESHNKECCVCNIKISGFIYRSILEPENFYCDKCAFSSDKIPPLLKIP